MEPVAVSQADTDQIAVECAIVRMVAAVQMDQVETEPVCAVVDSMEWTALGCARVMDRPAGTERLAMEAVAVIPDSLAVTVLECVTVTMARVLMEQVEMAAVYVRVDTMEVTAQIHVCV